MSVNDLINFWEQTICCLTAILNLSYFVIFKQLKIKAKICPCWRFALRWFASSVIQIFVHICLVIDYFSFLLNIAVIVEDIHICGLCRLQFTDMQVFLTHKQEGCMMQTAQTSQIVEPSGEVLMPSQDVKGEEDTKSSPCSQQPLVIVSVKPQAELTQVGD